jgi:hypothetical protein
MKEQHTTGQLKHHGGHILGPVEVLVAFCGESTVAGIHGSYGIGINEAKANARRLVACWNACQQIETETLEKFTLGVISAEHSLVTIERTRQRNEFLDALRLIADGDVMGGGHRHIDTVLAYQNIARAAIKKAEGGAA